MFAGGVHAQGKAAPFEVLARRFQLVDAAVVGDRQVIHDIDVHDGKFARAETPGIERLINGIALTQPDDEARIALGSQVSTPCTRRGGGSDHDDDTPPPATGATETGSGTLRMCCGTSCIWGRSASGARSRSRATCSATSSRSGGISKKDYVDGLALAQLAPRPARRAARDLPRVGEGRVLGATAVRLRSSCRRF